MLRAMKSIDEPSLPLIVYGPTRLTQGASHGVLITILGGKCPYFCVCFLFTWQVLHDFVLDRMVFLIPFQYTTAFIVSSEMGMPRVLEIQTPTITGKKYYRKKSTVIWPSQITVCRVKIQKPTITGKNYYQRIKVQLSGHLR